MVWKDPVVLEFCEKYGEADAEIVILRLCLELLAECPTERGPSPLAVLGSVRGIRGHYIGVIPQDASCSGLLIPKDGGYEVILNIEEPKERQHFSFAHEIVHTFFREIQPRVSEPSKEEERLCDIGAAELTMPSARFGAQMKDGSLCLELIDQLQEEFGVSFEAAGRRMLGMTDLAACMFIVSLARTKDQEIKNIGEPTLRIVAWSPSLNWPDKRSYKNLPITTDCIIAESFFDMDNRDGTGNLGVPFSSVVYDIETRSYEYQRGSILNYRQVVALAKLV